MISTYADQMAQALKDFDATQGINNDLNFYKEAIKFDFSSELGLDLYESGRDEYNMLDGADSFARIQGNRVVFPPIMRIRRGPFKMKIIGNDLSR